VITSDEKLDALRDSIISLTFTMESIKMRIDSVEDTLCKRQESINNIYDFMQKTDVRLTKIESYSSAANQMWVKMTPFLAVLLGAAVASAGTVMIHIFGGH